VRVYPENIKDKAKARWLEELAGSKVTELASGIFFQRFMRPMVFKQEADEELVDKIINKQLPLFWIILSHTSQLRALFLGNYA
jgi:glutathione S-transferase